MTTNASSSTIEDTSATADLGTEKYGQESPLADAGREAGDSAAHLAERAVDLGLQQADRGKQQAAEGITQVADSIRRVSIDMEGEQPAIAGAAQTAADQAERIATYLQQTDAREMVRAVEDVARRQPLLFLGGAFLLGVAASRLIKVAAGGTDAQTSATSRYGYGIGGTDTGSYRATGIGSNGLDELPSEGI